MESADIYYKCRSCGKTYVDSSCSKEMAENYFINISLDVKNKFIGPALYDVHCCTNIDRGLADLIGYSVV